MFLAMTSDLKFLALYGRKTVPKFECNNFTKARRGTVH